MSIEELFQKLMELNQKTLTEVQKEIADLRATLNHPGPEHCTKNETMKDIIARVKALEDAGAQYTKEKYTISGAWRVVTWILTAIGGFLGGLLYEWVRSKMYGH